MKNKRILVILGSLLLVAFLFQSCGGTKRAKHSSHASQRKTISHTSKSKTSVETGIYKRNVVAAYYHDKFNGRKTASGAIFDNNKQTTAHRNLPFGTQLKVTNRVNGKWVYVVVNDRGPFTKGRELDMSKKAWMSITHDTKIGLLDVDIEIVKN
ncbi:Lipoprotein A-like protein [Capnocytophaga canis]|uniref:Lipoprotein A-like protein n=1 Tax=Capnocytophaga canis TaxID=1848903 RepID=A0A0B7HYT6_9FLAO|nr:septal ring lytic transglycosylase RlpA family protein [Capnocytophaga canis]CEN44590.1 Lipoprotein A-like protein [Capnocytophaga canis]CEN45405.1 Lipoprotein A-like protein [Capnocytophaga canis]